MEVTKGGRPDGFFVGMALVGLAVALAGFSTTFFLPIAAGTFERPLGVWLHGAAAFGWVLLFVLQPALIRAGRYDVHARTGALGALLAVLVAVSAVPAGLYQVERDLAAGLGATAVSGLLGTITSMVLFLGLVAAGVAFRGRPATHKRLMLLATIVVLWPAWFRLRHLFPDVPRPEIWFALVAADSLILAAMLRDRLVEGRVHPVWWFVGLPVVIEQSLEVALFNSPGWRAAAAWLYGLVG